MKNNLRDGAMVREIFKVSSRHEDYGEERAKKDCPIVFIRHW